MTRPPTSTPRMAMISGSSRLAHAVHGVVDVGLVEVGDLAGHLIERAGFLADGDHLDHHVREQAGVLHGRCRRWPVELRRACAARPFRRRCCRWRRPPTAGLRPAARRRRTWSTACARSVRSPPCEDRADDRQLQQHAVERLTHLASSASGEVEEGVAAADHRCQPPSPWPARISTGR
jgi:hypothetical protein